MLHVRSVALRRPVDWLSWRDVLATSDQGLLRLQMAVRGTLSVFLTTVLAVVAGRMFQFSPVECAGGITLSMMAPFLMREPTRAQRQRTLVGLVIPAVLATLATAVLHGHGPAGDSVFLLLVFVCFLLGARSPRAIGQGLIAVITTYIGLYLELPVATLPLQVASQVVAVPVVALACFVLVPMDAAATLRRSVAAVQARAAQVIRQARALDDGMAAGGVGAGLRRAVLRLNQAALVADDQLAFFEPGAAGAVRSRLVEVELWTARLARHLELEEPEPGDDRRRAARLLLHARRIERGGRYSTAPSQYAADTLLGMLVGLGQAVHGLGQALADQRAVRTVPPVPVPPGPLAWRLATRVTLAAGLAMAGGMALSPQRWFWAVITVYVVFLNVRSRGETIFKGLQRLGGTVLGIGSGLVIATAFSGDGTAETVVLLLSVFGMYYTFLSSYTVGIFFVTVMLGLLYGMLGAPLEAVLLLRLEETAIGAAAAMVVAAFVLPDSTRARVRGAGLAVVAALSATVRESARAAGGEAPGSEAVAREMRKVDRMVADLRLALAPSIATGMLLRWPIGKQAGFERPVSALLDCVHWTRVVAAEGADREDAAALDGLADRLDAFGRGETPPAVADGETGAIGELARAVATLEERRELGAFEAFAL